MTVSRTPTFWDERWRWGSVVVVTVIAGFVLVVLADNRFFYSDDTESGAVPNWVLLGNLMRNGHLVPGLVPGEWMAGNYPVEGQGGLWNPPQALINLISPSVDNLILLATVVKLVFSVILALGVYRICLEYGARAPWAAVAGAAFPFTGFVLFYDQATWVTALTGTAWLTHAWASSVRYTRGRSGPVPVFVFLFLTITVGYIYPGLESAVMIACVMLGEGIYQRRWRPPLRLAMAAGCAAAAGAITYLPGVLSSSVTWRGGTSIVNDNVFTAPWSESLNASLPSTLPVLPWGETIQPYPSTYIAWFLIPALAFVNWGAVRSSLREISAVPVFLIVALLWSAGPGVMGPLRWPARVLPMVALGALILLCVLLSRHGTTSDLRGRSTAAAVLVVVMVVRAASSQPAVTKRHVAWAVAILVVGALALWVVRRFGTAAVCGLLMVSVLPVLFIQVLMASPHPLSWNLPGSRAQAQAAFPEWAGSTLQLGDRTLVKKEEETLDGAYKALVFGNYAKDLELDYVNAYTPVGYAAFSSLLCMRWDGSTCPEAMRWLFTAEPTTGKTLADLMKLDRVVLQRAQYPDIRQSAAPSGWTWVDYPQVQDQVFVLERVGGPISGVNGRIAHTDGVTAESVSETNETSTLRVSSDTGGKVVFARLAWPGYRATLGGEPVDFTTVDGTFVAVDVPAGTTDTELVVGWEAPGHLIGAATAAAGLLGIAALQWLFVRNRRREQHEQEKATPEMVHS